ncbi:uncharacterized protein LOC123228672 isoform X2 [Mangifera indica]|uniref:uncharacterized protein LOC123228672 isoform X2 n=1 Tax=Mangifera indica TaxID=29780 RepID=UPI001CF9A283|nr:uncharacterized protein LOC123228672 isoform X2 [Mangifera indica]
MATSRLFLTAEPLRHAFSSSTCSSSSSTNAVRCMGKAGFNGEKRICGNADQRRPTLPTKTSVAPLDSLLITTKPADFIDALLKVSRQILERRPWKSIQMLIERGSFLVLKSYFQFFNTLSPKNDHGHMVHLIIEAIDLFLVGTAMLIFGVGLYAMFVGSKNITEKEQLLSGSNLFGLFHMKRLPKWVEMESVWEAKSKLGHAVMIILQVGVLEKFNTITLVTSLDMVCFAGALLISSVCTFLLSRLSVSRNLPFHILS